MIDLNSINQVMVSFLQLVREDSLSRDAGEASTYTRSELIYLFHANFENKSDFSQILDLLFFNGLMDAESKVGVEFRGYYVTDLGVQYLRRPDAFSFRDEEPTGEKRHTRDSTAWTGKRLVLIDAKLISEITANAHQVHQAVHKIEFQSNSDSQDLKGLADALLAICDMAEPDVSLIDKITSHPKFKIYAGVFAAIATFRGALGL